MTWNDTASSNLNCGPPLSAVKGCPSSSKATTITDPAGLPWTSCPASGKRLTDVILEFLKTEQ